MYYVVIRTENLSKFYGVHRGVEELTFQVEPGEIFGLLGPQNAGKSTVVRLLLDFARPTSGRALIFGQDVRRNPQEIRSQVGFLPASFSMFDQFNGLGTLSFLAGLRRGADLTYARQLADRLGVDLKLPAARLSPADRQKIGLVQAFMHHPELLILDEPTRNLDAEAQKAFGQLMIEVRAQGSTVFFTSASLPEVERSCDRVGVLHQGHLIEVVRAVRLRSRSLRKVEMRFGCAVPVDAFANLTNLEDVRLEDNQLRCTVQGDPDSLIKIASQYRVTDMICQQPTLAEAYHRYYGLSDGVD
ncbi:MAG: ABC transporter ATP-binding protein [Anaerolineaceae bacterium]|nr:ABC transporter ATP-binding protein [Anaerolineaceae bacterium]